MTEHEYNKTEKRRTEGRRYQRGGRGSSQWDQQGGRTGQQPSSGTGGQTGQQGTSQTSYGTGGQMSQGPSDQQTGGRMGGGQTGSQMGSGRTGGQMDSGRTGGRMGGGQTGGQTGGGQMNRQTGQMGGQTSRGTGQISRRTGQTGRDTGRMGQETGQMGGQSFQQSQGLISPVTVSDVAATEVVTIQPDAPLSEIVQKMERENVGSVVVAEGNRPIGIVTDRKVALTLGKTQDVSQFQATDLMSEDLFTVPEGTNVFDLVRRLSDKGVRRVPVVGDRGDLKGIVSLDDVVVLLAEEFYNVSHIIRKQSPRF